MKHTAPAISRFLTTAVLALLSAACGGGAPLPAAVPNAGAEPTSLAKCRVAGARTEPLVTEWPASQKARLEALLVGGAIAVQYSGCELRLVPSCPVQGAYAYQPTTLSTDTTEIRDEDELFAKLPLGAVGLEGELQRFGRLAVRTTVAGQMRLTGASVTDVPHTAACADATHIVTALSVGAYKLLAGGAAHGAVHVGAGSVGAGGGTRHEEEIMREAGDPAACANATDGAPAPACRSPLQIFLEPIPNPERERRDAERERAEADARRERDDATESASTRRTWSYILGGIALSGLAGGTLLLLEGDGAESSVKSGGLQTGSDIDSSLSRARLEHGLGLGALIVGGVSLAIALPLFLTSRTSSAPSTAAR